MSDIYLEIVKETSPINPYNVFIYMVAIPMFIAGLYVVIKSKIDSRKQAVMHPLKGLGKKIQLQI